METGIDTDQLLAILGVVFLLARGYGAIIGEFQMEFADAIFEYFGTPSNQKRILNFAIGTAVAALATLVIATYIGDLRLIFIALVAGFFASTDAAKAHDAKKAEVTMARVDEKVTEAADAAYQEGRASVIASIRQRREQGDQRRPA